MGHEVHICVPVVGSGSICLPVVVPGVRADLYVIVTRAKAAPFKNGIIRIEVVLAIGRNYVEPMPIDVLFMAALAATSAVYMSG